MSVLVVIEHDRGEISSASLEALTAARSLNNGEPIVAAVCGGTEALSAACAGYGATEVVSLNHDVLNDYAPEAWGEAVAQLVAARAPRVVMACGTDRGNEVMAHVASVLDLPMVANCLSFDAAGAEGSWAMTRMQWGGSLMEDATLSAPTKLITVAHHSTDMVPSEVAETRTTFEPQLDASLARTRVVDRVVREAGVTLTTARVVVGGGRGVGSPEAFGILEELAGLLNGKVGCSRAVTNNGWRNHTDQVGQTGTRIAPDIYLACGISGAIQHWVGAMASKKILAINTDREANMVSRADYAVIGDLHKVIPAISAEIQRRPGISKQTAVRQG
jgi:electron transfer flavoprotein alpha subunit